VYHHAYKQLAELSDVHGSETADLAVQILLRSPDIDSMCVKMERLLKRAGTSQFTIRIGSALKFFGGIISKTDKLSEDTCTTIIRSCMRVTTDQSYVYPEDLKQLAQQVLDLLRPKAGDQYEHLMNQIMSTRAKERSDRRTARKVLAVSDPRTAAKLKIDRNKRKARARTRARQ
jgi:hypothetical protein